MTARLDKPTIPQRDEWVGVFTADNVGLRDIETLLGVDPDSWRIVAIDISVLGPTEVVEAYAVPQGTGWDALERAIRDNDGRVDVTRVAARENTIAEEWDTQPPPPTNLPLLSAAGILRHAYKRSTLRIYTSAIPDGAVLIPADSIVDDPESD